MDNHEQLEMVSWPYTTPHVYPVHVNQFSSAGSSSQQLNIALIGGDDIPSLAIVSAKTITYCCFMVV